MSSRATMDGRSGESAPRDTGIFECKQEAVDRAREITQNQGTEHLIHGRDGQIQSKDSHGHDPFPPKG
jgi:hypothetical protein